MLGLGLALPTQRSSSPVAALQTWLATHGDFPLMTTPPSVTLRAAQAVPSFSPRSYYDLLDERIELLLRKSTFAQSGSAALNDGVNRTFYAASGSYSGNIATHVLRFRSNADKIGFLIWSSPAFFQFIIDGQRMAGMAPAIGGGERRVLELDFGSSAEREIVVLVASTRLAGIFLPTTATLTSPRTPRGPVLGLAGDSYGQHPSLRFKYGLAAGIADRLGTAFLLNDAGGGTGFVTDNGGVTPADNDFLARLGFASTYNMLPPSVAQDICLTIGGMNDSAAITPAQVRAYVEARRAQQPHAVQVVVGPQCPRGDHAVNAGQKYLGIAQDIADGLAGLPGPWVYVDPLSNRWKNSRGRSGGDNDGPWITGVGRTAVFTAPLVAATSGTLNLAWNLATGAYTLAFSDTSTRVVTLNNGSAAVTWTGAVTADAAAQAFSNDGNAKLYIWDGTHLNEAGTEFWAAKAAQAIRAAILAL